MYLYNFFFTRFFDVLMSHFETDTCSPLPPLELLWKSLTDSIECSIVVIDRSYRIQFINRFEGGWVAADMLGRNVFDFVQPSSVEYSQAMIESVFQTGQACAFDIESFDAPNHPTTVYSVRAVPIQISGAVVSVVVTLIDTRLAQAAESLQRESQQNLQKLLTLHERERQLISYEIHDGLAQYLAGAAMQLEAFDHACRPHSKSILKDSFHFLEEGLRLVGASVDESRRLVSGMRPLSLDELGIISAVEILVDEARIDIPHVEYSWSEGILRFCPGLETTVFRIVQESLTNIRKHSDAHRASVRLERRGDSDLAIIVTDDGIGFDLTAVAANHFGIEGICQRAKIYGREALITSSIGKGSRVEVVLPFIPDTRNEQQS